MQGHSPQCTYELSFRQMAVITGYYANWPGQQSWCTAGDHWLPQIGLWSPGHGSTLLTWSVGVISSDYCHLSRLTHWAIVNNSHLCQLSFHCPGYWLRTHLLVINNLQKLINSSVYASVHLSAETVTTFSYPSCSMAVGNKLMVTLKFHLWSYLCPRSAVHLSSVLLCFSLHMM